MNNPYQMPMMNNSYMQSQNPYMDRMNFLQNYQQSLQQQPMPQQIAGINGRIVQAVENINANEVPMDGSMAFFPKQDMSEIYVKGWNADGTIRTIVYKPYTAPKGKGTYRRGYEEPPYMHMYPEAEHMRDMDRDYGKMYYTEPMNESGYDRAKRNYTETKEMHSGTTPEDKEQRMKALDKYIKTVTNEIIKIVSDNATTEEKSLIKNNMNNLMSKF